jgi:deazaflavin-dependent oxidoreductase (nitroreductase family)
MDGALAQEAFCYLTTIGRTTGERRRIEIWFAAAEAAPTIYMLAGARERAGWVRNLRKTPRVGVEIGRRRFDGMARVLVDDAPEATIARRLVYEKYRGTEDDLEEWRNTALPVAIDLG